MKSRFDIIADVSSALREGTTLVSSLLVLLVWEDFYSTLNCTIIRLFAVSLLLCSGSVTGNQRSLKRQIQTRMLQWAYYCFRYLITNKVKMKLEMKVEAYRTREETDERLIKLFSFRFYHLPTRTKRI